MDLPKELFEWCDGREMPVNGRKGSEKESDDSDERHSDSGTEGDCGKAPLPTTLAIRARIANECSNDPELA